MKRFAWFRGFVAFATVLWSVGFPALVPQLARAASTVSVSTSNLMNANFAGAPIPASSPATAIAKLTVTASQASQTLTSVSVNFNATATGFAQGDLAAIATGATSGVALYNDAGGTAGSFDGTDAVVTLAASPNWTSSTTNIILTAATPVALTSGVAKIFYVVVKTSGTISDADKIEATIPVSGIVTSDGSGPSTAFTANFFRADTAAASIASVSGFAGSATVMVKFNKPVQKVGGGNLAVGDTPLTYTEVSGDSAQTISSITHTAGQDFATITMSAALDAGDVDGSPSTFAAGSNKIADMGGNVIGTTAVGITSPLSIDLPNIPTVIAGATYSTGSPLVTLAAKGGAGSYVFTANAAADSTILAAAGLEILNDSGTYKLRGASGAAIPSNVALGTFNLTLKVTDGAAATATRMFTLNVGSASGAVPGITNVTPAGGGINASGISVTITGVNSHFTNSSVVSFLSSGTADATMVASSVAAASATSLTFSLAIGAASAGARDVKVVTGSETVIFPNGFGVFASGSAGLGLLFPSDALTNVAIPPSFSFSPSTNSSVNSYRIMVSSLSSFSGTPVWDYAFPKPVSGNGSHCTTSPCSVTYGAGTFRALTPPSVLAPNTTYYWVVMTYSSTVDAIVSGTSVSLEATPSRSFTTVSSITDSIAPTVMFRPVFQATASTNLDIFARVMDNVATLTTTPALTTTLFYCAGGGCTPTTEAATPTSVGAGYFKYRIPSATVSTAGTIVRYYIRASDGTNTTNFKMADGITPFQLTSTAAGASSIAGTVKDGSDTCAAGVQTAVVFAEGTGFNTTTNGSCIYTLSGVSAGTYSVVALKDGYADRMVSGIPAGATAIALKLGTGVGAGFGGDTTKPKVKFTGPMDGMKNMPGADSNFKIFVAFSKGMSQSTITATNMTVNEVNLSTGDQTNITSKGSWTYYFTAPSSGTGLPPEANLAAWTMTAGQTLGDGKNIAVAVKGDVTDTAGNAITSNQSDGSYVFSFTTGSTASFASFNATTGAFAGGGTFGTGAFVPPSVTGTIPGPGAFDVPVNSKLAVNFSEAMADDGGGYTLLSNLKLYTVSGTTETDVTSSMTATSLDSGKRVATVTRSGNFTASTSYRIKVLGGTKAATGMTLRPPANASDIVWMSDFKVGTGTDSGAPKVAGTFPNTSATGIPVNTAAVNVAFSKDMDAATITTSTVYLSIDATAVDATVEYKPTERQAFIVPKTALSPSTTYTINVTTDVKALNGTAIATAESRTFTTGAADTTAPNISFVNGDDYSLAVTYAEPMNSAKATDTLNFAASVLKSANYTLKYATVGSDSASGTAITMPATTTLTYDAATRTVVLSGYSSVAAATLLGKEVYVEVANVKDLSGNAITVAAGSNTAKAVLQNSATTKGALIPGATTGGSFAAAGAAVPTNFSSSTFGFAPMVEMRPFNILPGQTTIYHLGLPISKQIPAGGTIVLTFPNGFDVSGAKQDVNSPMRKDLNGPGTGTPTFKCTTAASGTSCGGAATITGDTSGDTSTKGGLADDGVIVNTSANSITIALSAATNTTNDFINVDIAGIKNSTTPKDFNTAGYTVDIKTKDTATLLETLTSKAFFIQGGAAGASTYTISGTVTAGSANTGTAKVYLMSPATGPMETDTATFSNGGGATGTAAYTFTGLPAGDYMLFTDPLVTLDSTDFIGRTVPDRVSVVAANVTKNFTLTSMASGTTTNVTVNITGGPASEPMDVFATSPVGGFRVQQVTLNGSGAGSVTLKLSDGQWNIGAGPQMPKGVAGAAPPVPAYFPPRPKSAKIANPACTVEGTVTCTVAFALGASSTTKTIKGIVKDGSGKIVADAQVFGYSPSAGQGTHATTDAAGAFTLTVGDGSYVVGAFVPGMPPAKDVPVVVTSHATQYLLIDGAQTTVTPATAATTFILKVAKPDYTISGKVTDGTSSIQGASVYAYRTDGPGGANVMTSADGTYTLYVSAGTWKVGTFLPQYGKLSEKTITVTTANQTDQNFSPSETGASGTFYTVSGTVTSGSLVSGAFVRISGNSTSNEAVTDSVGAYSFKVPACVTSGCYTLKASIPGTGDVPPLAPFALTTDVTKNFAPDASDTVTVNLSATVEKAFVTLTSTNGSSNSVEISNTNVATIKVPDEVGYKVSVDIPGMAITSSNITDTPSDGITTAITAAGVVTVNDSAEAITITIPSATLRTITGTVTDGSAAVANAWVDLSSPTTGVKIGAQAGSDGTFSLKAIDGSYFINATKPGYFRSPTALTVNAGAAAVAAADRPLVLAASTTSIAGQILIGSSGAANAFVRAEKQGGGFAGTQADASGNYTLPVTSGVWKVVAVADGYTEAALSASVDTTGGSATGKNITLTTATAATAPTSKPITPSSGGTVEDSTMGMELTLPANAIGTSSSAGNVQIDETTNVQATESATPLKSFDATANAYIPVAKEITATDSEGNALNTLNTPATMKMKYTKTELAATPSSTDSSINTKEEMERTKMARWDSSNATWTTLPSTITYENSAGATMDSSTSDLTPAEDLSNVSTVVIAANTSSFSTYAPVVSTDPSAPTTPTGFAAAAGSTTTMSLSWTLVSGATGYDIYRSDSSNGTYTRIGSEPTVSSGSTVAYTDTGLDSNSTYYYKISALNESGESAASSATSGTTSVASSSGGGGGSAYTQPSAVTTPIVTTVPTVLAPEIPSVPLSSLTAKAVVSAPAAKAAFSLDLKTGSENAEVTALQDVLIAKGFLVMPKGMDKGLFGRLTALAVKAFQKKNGLPETGAVGPATRAKLNGSAAATVAAPVVAGPLLQRVKGQILLDVQGHGEAWYVDPASSKRFYMKDGPTAYDMMRSFGLGASKANVAKLKAGDKTLVAQLKGRIVLDVENHGEAYYVNPADGKAHYLKDGAAAYEVMRSLSLGITAKDLATLEAGAFVKK